MIPDDYTVSDYTGCVLNKEEIDKRVEELSKAVLDDNKLKLTRTAIPYLLRFLHSTDFNVAAAFKRMQDFHDLVRNNPDWFKSVSPSERQEQLRLRSKGILKCRDKKGRAVYLIKIARVDASSSNPKNEIQFDEMWFESVFDDLKTQENGISIIADVNGYSLKFLRWLTPGTIKLCLKVIEIYPCKEFVLHIVNTSIFLNAAIKLLWPIVSDKLKKQVKFHFNNWNSLHEYISAEVLPPEYGGSGPEINFENLNEWLLNQDTRIRENLEYRKRLQDT